MVRVVGSGFSVDQRERIWDGWRGGESLGVIAGVVGSNHPRVSRFLRVSGGIRPASRCRRAGHLSLGEREEISRGIAAGRSARTIADQIGRASSTVSREITRNGGRELYRAAVADAAAYERALRPKPSKLATDPVLREMVAAKLGEDWSPQQIAGWLRHCHHGDAVPQVSHESIYRDLYIPSRNVFDRNMFHCLRSDRPFRRPRRKASSQGRGRIRNMVSIHDRPVEADTRELAGHWEGDLVFGIRPSAVATLVDRATRYALVVELPDGYKADAVARALVDCMGRLPGSMCRSLTWDRGREMAAHAVITEKLAMPVYFCDPHHPWQRGTNENTNRLLRQYLHKNADLSAFTQHDLDEIAEKLNHRPRRVLDWATPAERFAAAQHALLRLVGR
ncbi:IS30 family transposase [Nocardia neocaledoniensis]|uniref:IS30 family transposase n=1 Tax=Nocardia neocaledoniensis TaxID=236511 RepID=UPI002456E92A|nr:IS30 family transposase [Nocardia neocaledoniensis]